MGPNLIALPLEPFFQSWRSKNCIPLLVIPQSNGKIEATNKTLLSALKKKLEKAKEMWVDELPGVLWAYRTTPERPTENTPFALTYGMDVVILTEIGMPTAWTTVQGQRNKFRKLERHLD